MIQQVTSTEDFSDIINSNQKVLMEFYASWCPHCKAFYPTLDAASKTLNEEGIAVARTEIDTFEQIASAYGIESIPILTFFVNGELVAESAGSRDEQGIFEFVRSALAQQ